MYDMRRYINLLAEATGLLPIYRGEHGGNKGGSYYTMDREFARQFTQSGQDREIQTRWINRADIYVPPQPVSAAAATPEKEAAWDAAIAEAKGHGYKAVQFDEGPGEPPSIYMFDKTALRRP